eukprot:TRINITY_DN12282_c0_g1_i16.p1 TRINITY_DN12282_c0_g1~~TRINITY_DN12282_c0_g1_i16.p1  ORF type:complete len:338 (-),score=84.36 TRINITY_DN12282_c0_g1_i16:693-1706(-)
MNSPVLRSPQLHQGTPILKTLDLKKKQPDTPILKNLNLHKSQKQADTPILKALDINQRQKLGSIAQSPISSVIKDKKKFFKTVKFNTEINFCQDDNNNNNVEADNNNNNCEEDELKKGKVTPVTPPKTRPPSLEVDSPIAPEMVKARENCDLTGSEVEKLLMERLLIRKDLKLASMQDRITEIQSQMKEIKEKNTRVVKRLEEEAKRKDSEISRLQMENEELKELPGLFFLQLLVHVLQQTHLLAWAALQKVTFVQIVFGRIFGFYSWIFNASADCSEAACFFIEFTAIKLRIKLEEFKNLRKFHKSLQPKIEQHEKKARKNTASKARRRRKGLKAD